MSNLMSRLLIRGVCLQLWMWAVLPAFAAASTATLHVDAGKRSPRTVSRYLTGKFAEHLWANIYGGMEAQILRNPTFADFSFANGQMSPDGVALFHSEPEPIQRELRRQATRMGWPEPELENLVASRRDGLACWWMKEGGAVSVSPDIGPFGGRAQRLELSQAGQGIAQWVHLPLHRARKFEFEIFARGLEVNELAVAVFRAGSAEPCARASVAGLDAGWKKFAGQFEIQAEVPAEEICRFVLTSPQKGQLVIGRILLRPADHVQGADPDVVRLLKESHLPLLRWPGGNFVSGYHWEDGVGPLEKRPTRPNYAWGNVEPNTFGTDEFIAFCRAVGCEPMICVNAGAGTPEEAARWVEYCNGPVSSPMGARRAANGHPEPYRVRLWEVGNELWGRWQFYWTTAGGYVDRYRAFAPAMKAADASIELYACGAPVFWGKAWNDTLIHGLGSALTQTTDHPLIGGNVGPETEPLDVYRDFMAVPLVLEEKWTQLRRDMQAAGVVEPRLAVTELQMFAHLTGAPKADTTPKLTPETLVNPGTLGEALYDVLIYHTAIRLAPFVSLVTHSATVNHGGGLRKENERVYANPCHYAQAAFAAFADATPVEVTLTADRESAPRVLPELKNAVGSCEYGVIDAVAAAAVNGNLLISLVHRGTAGPVDLSVAIDGFVPKGPAQIRTLSAEVPWAANTLKSPENVVPKDSSIEMRDGKLRLRLERFSVTRVEFLPQ